MSTCDKAVWPGRSRAKTEARKLRSETGLSFRAYACERCGQWHLTTKRRDRPHHGARSGGPISRGRRPSPGQSLEDLAKQMRRERTGET